MGWNKGLTALAALGLAFSARPVLAEGQLHGVGKFMNGDSEVDVDTFSNVNAQGKEVRVGLLSILSNHKVISVTFDKTEMPALTRLWQSALGKQSPNWQPVGDYTETGTTDVSHLTVSAGPGVRFVIESPALGAFTSELAPSNFDRFGAALQSAESYVEAQEQ